LFLLQSECKSTGMSHTNQIYVTILLNKNEINL
jgi:hypothetical protein